MTIWDNNKRGGKIVKKSWIDEFSFKLHKAHKAFESI